MYSFPNFEPVCCSMSGSTYCFLICIHISQEAVRRYFHLLKNFPQFAVIHTVKGFSIVNEADVFHEFSCLFYDPAVVSNLISGSSAFSKSNLYIWKFSVHVPLKPSLMDFEHYLSSMWNECIQTQGTCHCVAPWLPKPPDHLSSFSTFSNLWMFLSYVMPRVFSCSWHKE